METLTKTECSAFLLKSNLTVDSLVDLAIGRLEQFVPGGVEITTDADKADVVLVCSGGVEGDYIRLLEGATIPPVILAGAEANAFAAATEICAYARWRGRSVLFEPLAEENHEQVRQAIAAARAARKLRQSVLGIIGMPSAWLVASIPSESAIRDRIGVRLERIPWSNVPIDLTPDKSEESPWRDAPRHTHEVSEDALERALAFSRNLRRYVRSKQLDAVAVECFSLLKTHHVSGCLALADLLENGLPASCEGDVCSALGMMFAQAALPDDVPLPWMANMTFRTGNRFWFSHCTVPPGNVKSVELRTHFESDSSVAIHGTYEEGSTVTLLRLAADLKTAYLTRGVIASAEAVETRCRTQIAVDVEAQPTEILGNHHLLISGDQTMPLEMLLKLLGFRLV
ncbi:hypothetical protein KQI84_12255 [bacterium]|nr:hypothetical protein [bacterium]